MATAASKGAEPSPQPKVLYRKYRPTRLEDVVGQEQITSVLSNSLKQGKIAHAYLFIGPRGTGKTSVARIFAHAVNGFDYQVEDNYLDIIEIDAASNTGVDNIRELREKAIIAPTTGKYKVYIIDEVHMLTKSASNALLKTLEEPPEHVIFIMATTDAYKVPITISSRTQVHTFHLATPETMQAHLRKISDAEGIKITDDALSIVVRRGGGSFRDSLSLLDQIASLSDTEITAEALSSALGLPEEQSISELLTAYSSQDMGKIHQILQDLLNTGLKPEVIASELISAVITAPSPEILPILGALPDVQPPFPEAKLLLALLSQNPSNSAPTPAKPAFAPRASAIPSTTATPVSPGAVPEASPKSTPPSHPTPAPKPRKTPPVAPEVPSAPAEVPAKTPSDVPTKTPKALTSAPQNFDWESFVEAVHQVNDAVYNQLRKVEYEYDGSTLHLYPDKKFTKSILDKPGNRQILAPYLGGAALVIHEPGERQLPEDGQISQISAIMGGVQEVKGDMPF